MPRGMALHCGAPVPSCLSLATSSAYLENEFSGTWILCYFLSQMQVISSGLALPTTECIAINLTTFDCLTLPRTANRAVIVCRFCMRRTHIRSVSQKTGFNRCHKGMNGKVCISMSFQHSPLFQQMRPAN